MISLILSLAAAQVADVASPELNTQLFRSTADGLGLLWTDQARRAVHGQFAGRLVGHYTDEPFVWLPDGEGAEKVALVSSVVQADLVGAYAYERLRVGAVLPIYLLSQGDLSGNETGLGDVALDARVTLLDAPDSVPLNLGLQGRLFLPTATVQAPLGDAGVGWEAALLGDVDLTDRVLMAANVGIRGAPATALDDQVTVNDAIDGRLATHVLLDPASDIGVALELATRGYLASGGAGTSVEWLLGGHGRLADSHAVLRAGFGTGLTGGVGTPDWRLVVGIGWEPPQVRDADGDGIVDDDDGCPQEPEDVDTFEDTDGCPDFDNDQDLVLDVADLCPLDPEDRDDFEDFNGCPDPDNDQDGIADVRDVCPVEAEDVDNYKDDDGCPDLDMPVAVRILSLDGQVIPLARASLSGPELKKSFKGEFKGGLVPGFYTLEAEANGFKKETMTFEVKEADQVFDLFLEAVATKAVVTRDRIDLKEKVFFDTGKATIQARSFGLLDDAVQILFDYPEIQKLRIEGHTDSRGSDESNKKLSQARAESVMKYLIDKGIDPSRLSAIGYGEERPLEEGNNEAAWSKNRRVDFFVEVWKDNEP